MQIISFCENFSRSVVQKKILNLKELNSHGLSHDKSMLWDNKCIIKNSKASVKFGENSL